MDVNLVSLQWLCFKGMENGCINLVRLQQLCFKGMENGCKSGEASAALF